MRTTKSPPRRGGGGRSSAFVAHDPAFASVVGERPTLERIAETDAHEGPVYVPGEDALYFTSVRRDRVAIRRLALSDGDVTTVLEDANMANGMAVDAHGRLVICEQGSLSQ